MKKIVMTVVAVTFAVVAAQAQSPRVEVMIMDGALGGSLSRAADYSAKVTSKQATDSSKTIVKQIASIQKAVEKEIALRIKEEAQKKEELAKAAASTEQGETVQTVADVQPAVNVEKATAGAAKNADNQDAGGTVLSALFGGPYPGETVGQYRTRLEAKSYPSFGNKL